MVDEWPFEFLPGNSSLIFRIILASNFATVHACFPPPRPESAAIFRCFAALSKAYAMHAHVYPRWDHRSRCLSLLRVLTIKSSCLSKYPRRFSFSTVFLPAVFRWIILDSLSIWVIGNYLHLNRITRLTINVFTRDA